MSRFVCFAFLPLVTGCLIVHDHDDDVLVGDPAPPVAETPILEAAIDRGRLIEAEPGEGAGAFVEYDGDGVWRLFTTCDTSITDIECDWDILVSIDPLDRMTLLEKEGLESGDFVIRVDRGALRLIALNSFGFDGMFFETPAGASVRFDVLLDGAADPRFINWIGDGGLHRGAPSNPIDLTPDSP